MAKTLKLSYKKAENKKLARYRIFNFYKKKHTIIGLAGPDLIDYVNFMKEKGFSDIRVYENNRKILKYQIPQIKKAGIQLNFTDILHAPVIKGAVYDLDFTTTISPVEEHIRKFKDERIVLTVNARVHKVEHIVTLFLDFIGATKTELKWDPTQKWGFVHTNKGTYEFETYNDSGATMLMIYSL